MAEQASKPKQMPKGGRKGGAVFPRIDLEQSIKYARRLVSKTHNGPQPKDVVYPGVLDTAGPAGNERISALKQFGLAVGDAATGFEATQESKSLCAAPPEEAQAYFRRAAVKPKVFKAIFDTYHGDEVSAAKLKQRAAQLNVHPDVTGVCVDLYVSSLKFANLVTVDGDKIIHVSNTALPEATPKAESDHQEAGLEVEETEVGEDEVQSKDQQLPPTAPFGATEKTGTPASVETVPGTPRAIFNVSVTLDSSLDTEKLEKQLQLLKRFGAI